jgi:hypothetical protein
MSVDFSIEAIDEKPKKHTNQGRKGSKYEPIITAFLESGHELVMIENTGLAGSYLSTVLNKIIKKKGIENIIISVRNQIVYIERG